MTQVSKYPIRKDVYEEIFETLLETIANLTTKKDVSAFFNEFLTPTERIMFAKRLAVGLLIAKSYDYKEIRELLKVSTATIASYSTFYKYGTGYKEVIKKILRNEKIEKFLLSLAGKVASVAAMGGAKSGSWIYLRNQIQKKKAKKKL